MQCVVFHFSVLHPVRPAHLSMDIPQLRWCDLQLCPTHSSSSQTSSKEISRMKISVLLAFQNQASRNSSQSVPSRKTTQLCSSRNYLSFLPIAFFLLRNLLPSFAFFSARLLVSHSDSHLTRLLWHLATESRNASCYPRDQFPSITPSSLTESNEAERSSVAATAQALTPLSASRSAAARHPSHY